jgi:hypothetical protein
VWKSWVKKLARSTSFIRLRKLGLKLTWEISELGRRRSENASAQELVEWVRSTPMASLFYRGAKGWVAGQGEWPGGSKFELPRSSKLHGTWGRAKVKVEWGKEGKGVKMWPRGRPTSWNSSQFLFPIQTCPLDAPPTRQKQKTLSLFSFFNVLFISFWIFYFWKMQVLKNQICCGKREIWKIGGFLERGKIKMQMAEEGWKIIYEITTDLFSP